LDVLASPGICEVSLSTASNTSLAVASAEAVPAVLDAKEATTAVATIARKIGRRLSLIMSLLPF
ncbi:MAG: hypothetical protein VXZ99_11985, partial [Pseudomonadota bacterium]|nr:hypothetical protein [Pseudomonadota bacterium]